MFAQEFCVGNKPNQCSPPEIVFQEGPICGRPRYSAFRTGLNLFSPRNCVSGISPVYVCPEILYREQAKSMFAPESLCPEQAHSMLASEIMRPTQALVYACLRNSVY